MPTPVVPGVDTAELGKYGGAILTIGAILRYAIPAYDKFVDGKEEKERERIEAFDRRVEEKVKEVTADLSKRLGEFETELRQLRHANRNNQDTMYRAAIALVPIPGTEKVVEMLTKAAGLPPLQPGDV